MKGASRRGPSQNRQHKAGRRRGRILLPGPPPASERRPIRSRMSKPPPNKGGEGGKAENVGRRGAASGCSIHVECRACACAHTCATPQARHPTNQKGLLTTGTSFWMDERRIAPGPVAKSPVQGWPAPGTHSATRRALPSPKPRRPSLKSPG